MGYYPAWLYEAIIEDDFKWEDSTRMTLEEFHREFTFHDSLWIGMYQDIQYTNDALLVFDWDMVWLPQRIKSKSNSKLNNDKNKVCNDFGDLFLVIKIKDIKQINVDGYKDIGQLQRGVSKSDFIKHDDDWIFLIEDQYGGEVQITYNGNIHFMFLTENKEIIKI